MPEPTEVAIPVAELADLHARVGRLEGAARMAALLLGGTPSSDEIRQIGRKLEEIAYPLHTTEAEEATT